MAMIPLYPCGKPCSTGTPITIVIHNSRSLIGTLGSTEFGLNRVRLFRVML